MARHAFCATRWNGPALTHIHHVIRWKIPSTKCGEALRTAIATYCHRKLMQTQHIYSTYYASETEGIGCETLQLPPHANSDYTSTQPYD